MTRVIPRTATAEIVDIGAALLAMLVPVGLVLSLASAGLALNFGISPLVALLVVVAAVGLVAGLIVLGLILLAVSTFRKHRDLEIAIDRARWIPRPEPEPLPAPAPLPEAPIVMSGVEHPEQIGGIDVADLEFFSRWIASGGSWAENVWKGRTLPNGYEMGSFDTYDGLIQLYVKAGIIVDRDGERRKPGRLAVTDVDEMMRRLHLTPTNPTTSG